MSHCTKSSKFGVISYMKHFLHIIKLAKNKKTLDVVLVGDKGVGKSSLCYSFFYNKKVAEPVGRFDSKTKRITYFKNTQGLNLHCWNNKEEDLEKFCKGQYFFVICYAINDKKSFDNVKKWKEIILNYSTDSMIVILGTKSDTKRVVTNKEVKKMVKDVNAAHYFNCSARKHSKVNIAFFFVIKFSVCAITQKYYVEKMKKRGNYEKSEKDDKSKFGKKKKKSKLDKTIYDILKKLKLLEYENNFIDSKMIYEDFSYLEDEEIEELIPDHFPRKRFKKYIEDNFRKEKREKEIESILKYGDPSKDEHELFEKHLVQAIKTYDLEKWAIDKKNVVEGKIIASGSFGVVRKGILKVGLLSFDVAIKSINVKDSVYRDQVIHELGVLSELSHNNIVKFYGSYNDEDSCHLILELCKGDLHDFKTKFGNSEKRLDIMIQIAEGMRYIHDHDIVHRDLKPRNILITEQNGKDVVKITDYGTSKHLESIADTFVGTIEYIAPEYLETGEKSKDDLKKIDVYSTGIIFWEVWTGLKPFSTLSDSNHFSKLIKIHKEEIRPDIKKIQNSNIKNLLLKCWDKQPKVRPSFKEICQELKNLKKWGEKSSE